MSDSKNGRAIVVMGVAGAGKSTIAARLAKRIGAVFIEGDNFHPAPNIEKMVAGFALDDEDRWPWLSRVGEEVARIAASGTTVVAACSALKRSYRDLLGRVSGLPLTFVYLEGSRELILERLAMRTGHFFPPSLLESQFTTLEPPERDEDAIVADLSVPLPELTEWIAGQLMKRAEAPSYSKGSVRQ